MTQTQRILERDDWQCAYGTYCERATHADHIVPVALRRRHKGFDTDEFLVAACKRHNWLKGTRRLAPVGFDLSLLPSTGWRHWAGDVESLRTVVK
jgi:hypothetical protein